MNKIMNNYDILSLNQKKIIKDNFYIEIEDDTLILTHTLSNLGEMYIYLDLISNLDLIEQLKKYLEKFNINNELKNIKNNQKTNNSLNNNIFELEQYITFINEIIINLENQKDK